jgi:hypothetical protein
MYKDPVSMAMPPLDLGIWGDLGVSYHTKHIAYMIMMIVKLYVLSKIKQSDDDQAIQQTSIKIFFNIY